MKIWPAYCVSGVLLIGLLGQQTPPSASNYRTVEPRTGKPFELLTDSETIEPTLDGGSPLPGWSGEGHMILVYDGRLPLTMPGRSTLVVYDVQRFE